VSPDPSKIKQSIRRIVCVNFGGIGDEILFAPVIEALKQELPDASLTLILEKRSQSVVDLLTGVDESIGLDIQGLSPLQRFWRMRQALTAQSYDLVIASGGHPLIAVLLASTGIKYRVGFENRTLTQALLTVAAPLAPKLLRTDYAAKMYFSLADAFLNWLQFGYQAPEAILPHLKPPGLEDLLWAKGLLRVEDPRRKILIHPGVSTISVQKNILKGWPSTSWAELIRLLAQAGHQVYLVGGPDDMDIVTDIRKLLPRSLANFQDLFGQTANLKQLAALIQASDLLVSVDSSPMHIAVGYGKAVVAMFGPTDEKTLLPTEDARFQAVVVPGLACRPCLWKMRNESCGNPVCLTVPVAAMRATIDSVLAQSLV
jgi:putative inorganic carbon (HCO3(-)) transporter